MRITIDPSRWIDSPDGVNWQLAAQGGPRGEPHTRLKDALSAVGVPEPQAHAATRSPGEIFRQRMNLLALPTMPVEAIGFGPIHFLLPRPDHRWTARRQIDGPVPRLLHVGTLEECGLFCFWDHLSRFGLICDLMCLPEILERAAERFFSEARFGKAVHGPSGQLSAVFSKGAEQ